MLFVMNKEILLADKAARGGEEEESEIYLWSLLMNSMRCYQIDSLLWIAKRARGKKKFACAGIRRPVSAVAAVEMKNDSQMWMKV